MSSPIRIVALTHDKVESNPAILPALQRVADETFIDTFGHLYSHKDLHTYLNEKNSQAHFLSYIDDPQVRVTVAVDGGEENILGYCVAGSCGLPHAEVTPACGELRRLYVLQAHRNKGVGTLLLEEALQSLEAPGRRLWVGVYSDNVGAQRLYQRYGFNRVGDYFFEVGDARDFEFIFARPKPSCVPELEEGK